MKMKYIAVAVCLLFVSGCATGGLRVTLKPETDFSRTSSITIEPIRWDYMGVGPILGDELTARGFNVISAAVAAHKEEYGDMLDSNDRGSAMRAYTKRVAEYKSDYLLQFGYNPGRNPSGIWQRFNSFWANIVDLRTGEIILSVRFKSGDIGRSPSSVVEEFVEELSQELPSW